MTNKQFAKLWAERHDKLLAQLKRLEQRKREGWGYRKVWRARHKVPEYTVRGHFAMIPVKKR